MLSSPTVSISWKPGLRANLASSWMSCGKVAEKSSVCLVDLFGRAFKIFSTSGLKTEGPVRQAAATIRSRRAFTNVNQVHKVALLDTHIDWMCREQTQQAESALLNDHITCIHHLESVKV